jgi:hypothetical protein
MLYLPVFTLAIISFYSVIASISTLTEQPVYICYFYLITLDIQALWTLDVAVEPDVEIHLLEEKVHVDHKEA